MRLVRSPIFWIVLLILPAGYALVQWVDSVGGPEGIQTRFGALAPAVTGSLQFALTLTPFPTDLFSIAHGTLYGVWIAAPLNWTVWWLASIVEFSLGRRARTDFDLETEMQRLPGWLRRFPAEHPAFLILSRQIPWAGGHIATLVPGALGVSLRRFLWCSAIAILPGAIGLALLGAGLLQAA